MEEATGARSGEDYVVEPGTRRGSILIVSRQNLHLTKKAVASAKAQDIPCDILVVDNASTDGTPQWLATKDITTICLSKQESLSACWNRGLRAFWSIGKKHCLIANNDVEIRRDAYHLLETHGGDFVTCVSVDRPEQLGKWFDREDVDLHATERPHPDHSCFFLRKSVTDRVGFFNESYYPAYGEDSEWHIRCHRAGIRAVCIDVPFLHHGASTLKHADPAEAAIIRRGADANRKRFKAQYGVEIGSPGYYALFGQ